MSKKRVGIDDRGLDDTPAFNPESLHIHVSASLGETNDDPVSAIAVYEGDLTVWSHESDDDDIVGRYRAWRMSIALAEQCGVGPFDVLDCWNGELAEYISLLPGADGRSNPEEAGLHSAWSRQTMRAIGDEFVNQDLLVISRIEILPAFRGHGCGLRAMHLLVQHLGQGCGVVAIKPFPLQSENRNADNAPAEWKRAMRFDAMPRNVKAGTAKLAAYYSTLGFVQVKGTKLMAATPETVAAYGRAAFSLRDW